MAPPSKLDKTSILTVALELVDERGYEALGVRAVARRLGVAPNALARHVGDLEMLRTHLAEHVFNELLTDVETARSSADGPLESTLAIASAYFAYAVTHPARWPLVALGTKSTVGTIGYEALRDEVSRALDDSRSPIQVATAVWGVAHGTAGLVIEGALDGDIAGRAVRSAVRGILTDSG